MVKDFDPVNNTGNGFDFIAEDHREMQRAIERALKIYEKKELWRKVMENAGGDSNDFGWQTAMKEYLRMYREAKKKSDSRRFYREQRC